MTLLDVNALHAGYGKKQVLADVCFSSDSHELTGVLGPNGCGKTTLLKVLCGILPSQGEIRMAGRDIRRLTPRQLAALCRYIPQRCGITIDISLTDVVLMGFNPQLALLAYPSADMRRQAWDALETVGLGDKKYANFQTLSEGQKQLCLLARALLLSQGVLLLDEPESALDFRERYRMLGLIRAWLAQRDGCAVVTLHDPQLALNTCDRLLLMQDGQLVSALSPKTDSEETLEKALSALFGPLSVCRFHDHEGRSQLILLNEG